MQRGDVYMVSLSRAGHHRVALLAGNVGTSKLLW